ncbi:hypothetical protein CTI12_AA391480 [Artemisia annua]|uniref:DUF6857 domain-containing protein n=1 Tax=Artemisia annua TaxID=35608 RepID=A0A2U1MDW7_ARTAN|nr:hypothetical protein CTI12_AA391480 [Artemisia annua]
MQSIDTESHLHPNVVPDHDKGKQKLDAFSCVTPSSYMDATRLSNLANDMNVWNGQPMQVPTVDDAGAFTEMVTSIDVIPCGPKNLDFFMGSVSDSQHVVHPITVMSMAPQYLQADAIIETEFQPPARTVRRYCRHADRPRGLDSRRTPSVAHQSYQCGQKATISRRLSDAHDSPTAKKVRASLCETLPMPERSTTIALGINLHEKKWSDDSVSLDAHSSNIARLGQNAMQRRNLASVAAAEPLQEALAENPLPTIDRYMVVYYEVVKTTTTAQSVASNHIRSMAHDNATPTYHSKSLALWVEGALATDLEVVSLLASQGIESPSQLQKKCHSQGIESPSQLQKKDLLEPANMSERALSSSLRDNSCKLIGWNELEGEPRIQKQEWVGILPRAQENQRLLPKAINTKLFYNGSHIRPFVASVPFKYLKRLIQAFAELLENCPHIEFSWYRLFLQPVEAALDIRPVVASVPFKYLKRLIQAFAELLENCPHIEFSWYRETFEDAAMVATQKISIAENYGQEVIKACENADKIAELINDSLVMLELAKELHERCKRY